jgi:iron(III) transport system substrate-binding protein
MSQRTALAAGLLAACAFQAQANTELTVYTALEVEQLKAYKQAFEQKNPDIEIKWVRDSTGIVTAKLLAEKDRPQADVVWGLAGSSLAILKQQGLLDAYSPANLGQIAANYRDADTPPTWVGMDVWAASICFNTVEAQKLGLPKPTRWEDLANPVYQGKIVMPNPASSGTGYLDVSAWLQTFGEAKAGPTWTSCTPISASTLTPVPNRANWRPPASSPLVSHSNIQPFSSSARARHWTSCCPPKAWVGKSKPPP